MAAGDGQARAAYKTLVRRDENPRSPSSLTFTSTATDSTYQLRYQPCPKAHIK